MTYTFTMKKYILPTLMFLYVSVNIFSIDENYYLSRFSRLLNQYEQFMLEKGNRSSEYYTAFELFTEKLYANETIFSLDTNNSNLVSGGAHFQISEDKESYFISVGYKLVDIYDFYPTLIYSILTHEIWHAYAYITNPDGFLMQDTDPFEKLLYEFDAIYYEGLFIEESVKGSGFILSDFEDYLQKCYKENQMSDFISALYKVDYYSINTLYNLRNEYYELKNREVLDQGIKELGEMILKYYQESVTGDDLWFRYKMLVAIQTYTEYSVVLFKQTEGNENPEQTWGEIYEIYGDYHTIYLKMSEILNENPTFVKEKNQEYLDHFNRDLFY